MSHDRTSLPPTAARWLALLLLCGSLATQAASLRLGDVEFPTSARSQEAQQHFVRGLAALHSFWYPVAREAFQQAAKVEPGFAMAYWGEAMTHNHPVWGDPQDTEAGRAALQRIGDGAGITARERAYIDAVRTLYGDGTKPARDKAYAEAMRKLHQRFPQDAEAALFYALALLGNGGEAARLRAGAIALKVFEDKPNHPGAAHYTIHAYDDPEHARLALSAARRYAGIAPDAAHALHMPSHVFVQLGMWAEAAASNERSWAASARWARERQAPAALDFHSLHWLLYAYLQQGRYGDAEALLATMREAAAALPRDDSPRLVFATYTQALMAATWLIETEQWQRSRQILGPPPQPEDAYAALANSPAIFARGLAAARTGAAAEAGAAAAALRSLPAPPEAAELPYVKAIVAAARTQSQLIDAAVAAERRDFAKALDVMRRVVADTAKGPAPSGPPHLIKPPHELLAEIALQARRSEQAQASYRITLERHPGRARSLLGGVRAAEARGDAKRAQEWRARLQRQWKGAPLGS